MLGGREREDFVMICNTVPKLNSLSHEGGCDNIMVIAQGLLTK